MEELKRKAVRDTHGMQSKISPLIQEEEEQVKKRREQEEEEAKKKERAEAIQRKREQMKVIFVHEGGRQIVAVLKNTVVC